VGGGDSPPPPTPEGACGVGSVGYRPTKSIQVFECMGVPVSSYISENADGACTATQEEDWGFLCEHYARKHAIVYQIHHHWFHHRVFHVPELPSTHQIQTHVVALVPSSQQLRSTKHFTQNYKVAALGGS